MQLLFSLCETLLQYGTDIWCDVTFTVVWCIHSHREIVPHHPIRLWQTRLQSWQEKVPLSESSPFPAAPAADMAAIGFRVEISSLQHKLSPIEVGPFGFLQPLPVIGGRVGRPASQPICITGPFVVMSAGYRSLLASGPWLKFKRNSKLVLGSLYNNNNNNINFIYDLYST